MVTGPAGARRTGLLGYNRARVATKGRPHRCRAAGPALKGPAIPDKEPIDGQRPEPGGVDPSLLPDTTVAGGMASALEEGLAEEAASREAGLAKTGEFPTQSVARSTAQMSVSTMLSRVTGFARIWAQGIALGVFALTTSYGYANTIPNMVYEFVAGGILSSMFIPVFMERLAADGEEKARDFASDVFWLAMIGLGIVSLVGTIWPEPFVATQIAPGANPTIAPDAAFLFRFFAIQMLIYGAGAVMTGILNAKRVFLPSAIGPVFNNIVVIATFFVAYPLLNQAHNGNAAARPLALTILGVGTTLGVVAQIAPQIPALLKTGFRFRARLDLKDPTLRRLGLLAIPLLFYVGTNLVAVSFRNRFASITPMPPGIQPGSGGGLLMYPWVFYQLPYGIFAVALATAFFPELSAAANRTDWRQFADYFSRGLRTTGLLIMPCAALLIALSTPIAKLFQGGNFEAIAVAPVAQVLSMWALGVFSFAAFMFILRSFYSMQDTRTPALMNIPATALQIGLYWTLTQGIAGWPGIGIVGIPAADVVTYTLLGIALLVVLRVRIGPLGLGVAAGSLVRSLVVAIGAGLTAWAVVALTPGLGGSRFGFLLQLVAGTAAGLVIAAGLAVALRIPEVAMARRLIGRVVARLIPGRG